MANDWKSKASERIKAATSDISDFAGKVKTQFQQTEVHAKIEKSSHNLMHLLEQKGVPEKTRQLKETIDGHIDTLSGQKLLLIVEERLALQMRYNDVLASRLEEALERIANLEAAAKKSVS